MNQDDLEQELWRLRSVEIELERIMAERDQLVNTVEQLLPVVKKQSKIIEEASARNKDLDYNLKQANAEEEKMRVAYETVVKERDWAIKKLEEHQEADYMYQNYDFEVVKEGRAERKKRGWRLGS